VGLRIRSGIHMLDKYGRIKGRVRITECLPNGNVFDSVVANLVVMQVRTQIRDRFFGDVAAPISPISGMRFGYYRVAGAAVTLPTVNKDVSLFTPINVDDGSGVMVAERAIIRKEKNPDCTPSVITPNIATFEVDLETSVPTFFYNELGLYQEDGTMFARVGFDERKKIAGLKTTISWTIFY